MIALTPAEIVKQLDEEIAGQREAKKILALTLRQRWRQQQLQPTNRQQSSHLPHILMMGTEGTGKLSLATSAARTLKLPFARIEAGQLWTAQGSDVSTLVIERFVALQRVNGALNGNQPGRGDIESLLDRAVIVINNIDLIVERDQPNARGEIIQRELLPLLDGDPIPTSHGTVRPGNALIVGIGAFTTLRPGDLLPAFLARFARQVEFEELSEEDCLTILRRKPSSPADHLTQLLATEEIAIRFTDDGLREIARTAVLLNQRHEDLGARRLRLLLEHVVEPVSFDVEAHRGSTVEIDERYVRDRLADIVEDEDLERFIL